MLKILLLLCATLGYRNPPRDVLDVIVKHAPDEKTARLMTVWAAKESGFRNNPPPQSKDAISGAAQCFLQVHSATPLTLDECASRWLGILHAGVMRCGSLDGGLRSLSSGRCDGASALVVDRMRLAGVEP